jgi:hypothetical protein
MGGSSRSQQFVQLGVNLLKFLAVQPGQFRDDLLRAHVGKMPFFLELVNFLRFHKMCACCDNRCGKQRIQQWPNPLQAI